VLSELNSLKKENTLPSKICSEKIVCGYFNGTEKFQVLRIKDNRCGFERVILPGQQIMFEAVADAYLEIHTNEMVTAILEDKICCYKLCVE
jgi:hypothetical protein